MRRVARSEARRTYRARSIQEPPFPAKRNGTRPSPYAGSSLRPGGTHSWTECAELPDRKHGEHIERDRSKNHLFPPNVTEPGHHRMQGHLFGRAELTPGPNAQSCQIGSTANISSEIDPRTTFSRQT